MELKKEIKSAIYLILLLGFSLTVFTFVSVGFENSSKYWKVIIGYVLLIILFSLLNKFFKKKYFEYPLLFLYLPLGILVLLVYSALPMMMMTFFGILFLTMCFVIPTSFILINQNFHFIELTKSMEIYINFSFSTCFALLFHKTITKIVFYFVILNENMNRIFEKYELKKAISYINESKNIQFLIYTIYFIYMVIFSIEICSHDGKFSLNLYDKAIAQSFVTFLAFDRLLVNAPKIEFLPSQLFSFIWSSIGKALKGKEEENSEDNKVAE